MSFIFGGIARAFAQAGVVSPGLGRVPTEQDIQRKEAERAARRAASPINRFVKPAIFLGVGAAALTALPAGAKAALGKVTKSTAGKVAGTLVKARSFATPPISPEGKADMSLLGSIASFGGSVTPILQGLGQITGSSKLAKAGNISAALAGRPVMPGVGQLQRGFLPAALPTIAREGARAGAAGAAALGLGSMFGGGEKRRPRRMNPLNVRAARRAIRRIKAVRKITQQIEKSLPTRTVTRRAPSGHRARLQHK